MMIILAVVLYHLVDDQINKQPTGSRRQLAIPVVGCQYHSSIYMAFQYGLDVLTIQNEHVDDNHSI